MVDIRLPIGFMFSLLGVLITIHGAITASDTQMYERSMGVNINIIMGIVMLVFGLMMLFLAYRKKRKSA